MNKENLAIKISKLRNQRLDKDKEIYEVDRPVYHCLARGKGEISVYEEKMFNIEVQIKIY